MPSVAKGETRTLYMHVVSCDQAYLTLYTKEGEESLHILPYFIRSKAKCLHSQMAKSFCDAVKWSKQQKDSQDFLTPVAAV